jgi:hypothetical protein
MAEEAQRIKRSLKTVTLMIGLLLQLFRSF